jgi:hypothetical protein
MRPPTAPRVISPNDCFIAVFTASCVGQPTFPDKPEIFWLAFWHRLWHQFRHHFEHHEDAMTTGEDKVAENQLRRKLDRMGYRLMKSRARDPDDLTFGGYQIVDVQINGLVAGFGNAGRGYSYSLDDVRGWVRDETEGENSRGTQR